jgi:glycosyltransferase involved in cell wall biosynthesis
VNGLLYPALDHQALGEAMLTLTNNPDLRKSMGVAGRRFAEERFSVREYLSNLYQAYGVDVDRSAATAVAPVKAEAAAAVAGGTR